MNQVEQIIQYLKDFGSITTYDSFIDLGITRLASRMYDIRQMGIELEEEWLTKKNRYGKPVSYKKYMLKK